MRKRRTRFQTIGRHSRCIEDVTHLHSSSSSAPRTKRSAHSKRNEVDVGVHWFVLFLLDVQSFPTSQSVPNGIRGAYTSGMRCVHLTPSRRRFVPFDMKSAMERRELFVCLFWEWNGAPTLCGCTFYHSSRRIHPHPSDTCHGPSEHGTMLLHITTLRSIVTDPREGWNDAWFTMSTKSKKERNRRMARGGDA